MNYARFMAKMTHFVGPNHKVCSQVFFVVVHLFCTSLALPGRVERKADDRDYKATRVEDLISTNMYMSEHCRSMMFGVFLDAKYEYIDDQTFLMLHPIEDIHQSSMYIKLKPNQCVTTFAAIPGYRLMLHFIDIAIDNRQKYKSSLDIYSGFEADKRLSPPHGLFGETKGPSETYTNIVMRDYISDNQALTLMFTGFLSKRFYGFKAILTPVRVPFRYNNSCPVGMFRCEKNFYCISATLVCNGVPNCGDRDLSDEDNNQCAAPKVYQLTGANLEDLGLMIGCGVSVLMLLLAVVWVAVMCRKRHRLQEQHVETVQTHWHSDALEYARSLPRTLHNHLVPWMFREPPPAYSETPAAGDLPPPYVEDPTTNERRSLITPRHRAEPSAPPPDDAMATAGVIANHGAELPKDTVPSYEESMRMSGGRVAPQPDPKGPPPSV